jgi:hypothetical protein
MISELLRNLAKNPFKISKWNDFPHYFLELSNIFPPECKKL